MQTMGLIGYGTIGQELVGYLARELAAGELALAGVVTRHPERLRPLPWGAAALTIDAAISAADLVVECAGVAAHPLTA